MLRKERIIYLDYAKIVVTFLVVYGHLISMSAPERPYIYAFHMPFFFLVSGMLHKSKESFINGVKDATLKLFVPSVFFMAVYRVYQFGWDLFYDGLCFSVAFPTMLSNLWMSVKSIILGNHDIMGNGVCWFLFALFWHKVLTLLCDKNKWLFLTAIIVLLVIIALGCNVMFIKQSLKNIPFYMTGYLFSSKLHSFVGKTRMIWLALGGGNGHWN